MARRTIVSAVVAGLAVACLAGCSIGGTSDTATQSVPSTGSVPQQQLAPPNELTKMHCVADKSGNWSFSGVVTNLQKVEQKFEVTASVMDTKTWKSVAEKKITVKVAAGKSAPVAAKSFHRSKKAAGLQCQARTIRSNV